MMANFEWGKRYNSTLSFNFGARRGAGGICHALATLPPVETIGAHCTGGWVGLEVSMSGIENSPKPGSQSRIVQTVASYRTDYAIPVTVNKNMLRN